MRHFNFLVFLTNIKSKGHLVFDNQFAFLQTGYFGANFLQFSTADTEKVFNYSNCYYLLFTHGNRLLLLNTHSNQTILALIKNDTIILVYYLYLVLVYLSLYKPKNLQ